MESITSQRNPRIQLIRSLRQRKERQSTGLFAVEGTFHIGLALDQKAPLEYIVYAQELLTTPYSKTLIERVTQTRVPCFQTTLQVFETLGGKENPHGILAVARQQHIEISEYAPGAHSISVALEEPADPGNLGSTLRTLDAVGGEALIVVDGGVDPYHPNAVRAGLGAHFCHPIIICSFAEFTTWRSKHKVQVIGTSPDSGSNYRQMAVQQPAVLYLGSERDGLSKEQLSICDQSVRIPMSGKVNSLNLSVAAGILLYAMIGDHPRA